MNYLKAGLGAALALAAGGQILLAADTKSKPKPAAAVAAGANATAAHAQKAVDQTREAAPKAAEVPSMTLDDAVRMALKQNPQVLAAIQTIEATKGQIITVRAEALPDVTLSGAYNQQSRGLVKSPTSSGTSSGGGSSSSSGGGGQEKTWVVSVQATQQLYSPAVGAAIKIAHLTIDSNYFNLRDVVDQTISSVRQQFYQVLLDRELIKVQEQSVELLKSQLKDQQNRLAAGTVPQFNVLQAQVALANQLPQLIKARETFSVDVLALARTLGIQYNPLRAGRPPFNPVGDLTVNEMDIDEAEAIQLAKQQRAFLKEQRQSILIQAQQVRVALAGYQPTLSASGGYELRNSPFVANDDLSRTVNGWFFGVNGDWAIFDSGATYGRVKTARAQLETAKVNYDDAVLQVELQVQQAIASLKEASETIQSQVKSVEEATEALREARERLDTGVGVQLDVLNAQVALLTAQSNQLQAERDYNVALAQFEYATGIATRYNELFDDPMLHPKLYDPKSGTTPGPGATPAKSAGKISPKD